MKLTKEIEKNALKEIQALSIKISDLINVEEYSQIPYLSKQREDIINNFTKHNSDSFKNNINSLLENNKRDIDLIVLQKNKLQNSFVKSIKRFSAYDL